MNESIAFLLNNPQYIGHMVGFTDLTDLHGEWIRQIVFGEEDYTLQAHRGAYKSSALAVGISLIQIIYPDRNTIFIRKADTDVEEMMRMVSKIMRTQIIQDIVMALYDKPLLIESESASHLSTNLWYSPMGAPQLLGIGLKSSITGKHSWYVITDDICNITDRISKAERERTKLQYDELQNIRNRGGRIINLGTPWHKEDVFSKMPNIHKYDCYTTGLLTQEKIDELRQSMAPSFFAANYELQHIASEDALFTTAPQYFSDDEMLRDGISHIDAAYGGPDNTAFTCGAYKDGIFYLYGRMWHKHVNKVLPTCLEEAKRFMCWPLYSEKNGDKGFVTGEIKSFDCWARSYTESQNKFIKISTYLCKWWPKIRFHVDTDPEYIQQILDYTEDAEHDDAPDSAASLVRILDRRAFVA